MIITQNYEYEEKKQAKFFLEILKLYEYIILTRIIFEEFRKKIEDNNVEKIPCVFKKFMILKIIIQSKYEKIIRKQNLKMLMKCSRIFLNF